MKVLLIFLIISTYSKVTWKNSKLKESVYEHKVKKMTKDPVETVEEVKNKEENINQEHIKTFNYWKKKREMAIKKAHERVRTQKEALEKLKIKKEKINKENQNDPNNDYIREKEEYLRKYK